MTDDIPVQTIVEGRGPPALGAQLTDFHASTNPLPPQLPPTSLVQNPADPSWWRAVSLWRSQAALEQYRRTVATPAAIQLFRTAGADPVVTLWQVVATRST